MSWEPNSEEIRLRKQREEIEKLQREILYFGQSINTSTPFVTNSIGSSSGLPPFNLGVIGDVVKSITNGGTIYNPTVGVIPAVGSLIKLIANVLEGGNAQVNIIEGGINGQKISFKPEFNETITFNPTDPTTNASTVGNIIMSSSLTINDNQIATFRYQEDILYTDGLGGWILETVSGGIGDNLGNHTATTNLNMATFDILQPDRLFWETNVVIQAVDTAPIDGTLDRLEYNAGNLGGHDFFVDRTNTTIPRFGITETSIESNVPLDMNLNHIIFQGISPPSTVTNEPQLFADSTNSNHLSVKSGSGTVYDLESAGGDNLGNHTATQLLDMGGFSIDNIDDTILSGDLRFVPTTGNESKINIASNSTSMNFFMNGSNYVNFVEDSSDGVVFVKGGNFGGTIKTISTDATPTNGAVVGKFVFDAFDSSLSNETFAQIVGRTKVVTNGSEEGSINFELRDGSGTNTVSKYYMDPTTLRPSSATPDVDLGSTLFLWRDIYGQFLHANGIDSLPSVNLYRDDTTVSAGNFLGAINFSGDITGTDNVTQATIIGKNVSVNTSTYTSKLDFSVYNSGSPITMSFDGTSGTLDMNNNDITMGTGEISAGGATKEINNIGELVFVNNTLTPAGNGIIYFDGTDLKAKTGSTTVNLTNIGGANFTDAVFRVTDELDLTKKFAVDVTGNSTGVVTTLDFNASSARTYSFPDVTGTVITDTGSQTISGSKTFSNNIIAGGAGDGMTNIGHLDFIDNLATPVSGLSIYSDGTSLIANTNSAVGNLVITPAMETLDMNYNIVDNIQNLISGITNPASTGFMRLGNSEQISWRNAGNTADYYIKLDGLNTFEINAPIVPNSAGILNIGAPLIRFATGWFTNIDANNLLACTLDGSNNLDGTAVISALNYNLGLRQTFRPNGTNSGFNVGSNSSDPTSPLNGDIIYNTTSNTFRFRQNGSWEELGGGGGGITASDNVTWTGTHTFNNNVTIGSSSTLSINGSIGTDTIPNLDNFWNLGSGTKRWAGFFSTRYRFDATERSIILNSNNIDYIINSSSGDHRFFNNGTSFPEMTITDGAIVVNGGNRIRSGGSSEIGYYVTNATSTVGNAGTNQLPYISSTINAPSSLVLDQWFGSENGCCGIQYYSSGPSHRFWAKSNGSWVKTFFT